ncbi:MAG: OprO/OprP family phosphate-selective porin [Planctomycetaceae bacterium]
MRRNALALLAAVLFCAPAGLAQAAEPAQPGSPPTREDYDALVERLERAETQIQQFQQPSSSAFGAQDGDAASLPGDATSSPNLPSFDDLERRFETFRETLAQKTFPFVELHGAVQFDTGWYGQDQISIDEFGVLKDGADFRRTRLSANGAIAPTVNYFVQMDFSFPGRPTFTDVWVEFTQLPLLGNLRAGQWKQPFSLEVVSSFRYTMMPERSLLFQAFTPFRHPAVGFYNWSEDERMTWAASVYRSGQDQYGDSIASRGGYAGVGRITGLPWYEDDGSRYLHLGAAYNYVAPNGRFGGFRTIPEFFIGQHDIAANGTAGTATPTLLNGTPFFVNTGNFFMNHYNLVGTELLWVEGPLTVQSEFMHLTATRENGVGANFNGFYTQIGYFLTGEHRPYIKRAGALDRIKVLCDFDIDKSQWGGWEIATRFSYIDLNSKDIRGGRLFDYTLCLNWYLNSYTKVQAEYIRAALASPTFGDSITNLYDLRIQWDF